MFKSISATLIWSDQYRALADWYIEKLDLPVIEDLNHPEDTGVGLRIGDSYLWIGKHDKVHGKNQDPHRHMFNISVDSVEAAYQSMIAKGVQFYATPFKAPTFEKWFATFWDIDGNLIQLIGGK